MSQAAQKVKDTRAAAAPTTSLLAAFLSYLVPGLGQIWLGKKTKGLMFMACLLGMFFAGQALGDWQNVYIPSVAKGPPSEEEVEMARIRGERRAPGWENNPWRIPFLAVANVVHHRWHFAGQMWIGIAAWPAIWQYNRLPVPSEQASPFWNRLQKAPDEWALREYLRNRDKMPDLAWVYTVVAGMLNILVIYDAYAGPAYGRGLLRNGKPAEAPAT